jgi:glycosyltransferase involved in cell wall biosynthesis
MNSPLVSVALATYNGSTFLREQLDSIYAQTYEPIEVVVCDDKSTDQTVEILEEYRQRYKLKYYVNDKNLRVVKNFEKVMRLCSGEYVALCDQDDVWLPDKIQKSLGKMHQLEEQAGGHVPLLVFTDLKVADEQLKVRHPSFWRLMKHNPEHHTLNRLLVGHLVTGCTILANKTLVKMAADIPPGAFMHDMWMAWIAAYFGKIAYISEPTVLYRQHGNNVVGATHRTWGQFFENVVRKVSKFDFRTLGPELEQAELFSTHFKDELDRQPGNRQVITEFLNCKHANILYRKYMLVKHGFWGNTLRRSLDIFVRF